MAWNRRITRRSVRCVTRVLAQDELRADGAGGSRFVERILTVMSSLPVAARRVAGCWSFSRTPSPLIKVSLRNQHSSPMGREWLQQVC